MSTDEHVKFWENEKQKFEKVLASGEPWVSNGREDFEKYLKFVEKNITEEKMAIQNSGGDEMPWNKERVKTLKDLVSMGEYRIKQLEGFLVTKKPWTEDQLAKIAYELEDLKEINKKDKEHLDFAIKTVGDVL